MAQMLSKICCLIPFASFRTIVVVDWLLNVPAACECISVTDLHQQFTCCHTEIEVANQTFYLTQSQYTDIGPTSPSTDPITPEPILKSLVWLKFRRKQDLNPGSSALEADALTTRPTRRSCRANKLPSKEKFLTKC